MGEPANDAVTGALRMSQDMLLIVQAVFDIKGRGTVISGELLAGSVAVGDEVSVTGPSGESRVARVEGIERFRKEIQHAEVGPGSVGLLVRGVGRDDVAVGSSVGAAGRPIEAVIAPASPTAPAAWASDPSGRHELRYWDGTEWTGHVADAGVVAEDPLTTDAHLSAAGTTGAPAPVTGANQDLERLRGRVSEQLARFGPQVFARLKLDIDPMLLPERILLLGGELARANRPGKALDVLSTRASIYEALGMQTEADRDRLAWAAIKEGHSGLSHTSKEWAAGIFGLEYGSTFSAAYALSVKDEGKKVRVPLMRAGRAVALGYCPKCGSVQQLNERLHCPRGHTKIDDIACVVPGDVTATAGALEAAHAR